MLLYDGPIEDPSATRHEVEAELARLRAWLLDPEADLPDGTRRQLNEIIEHGERRLTEGLFYGSTGPGDRDPGS